MIRVGPRSGLVIVQVAFEAAQQRGGVVHRLGAGLFHHYLHERDADFVFCIKDNRPTLFDAVNALDWQQVPVTHAATDRATAGSKPAPYS